MDRKTMLKCALKLAIPMMIQNGITNAVGLVDHVMVGTLGTEQMTAVSIISQLLYVFSLALFGGLSGPGIYTAQFHGQGNTEGVRNSTRMKAHICIVCLVVSFSVLLIGETFLIHQYLHGESGTIDTALTMQYAKNYLHIMIAGLPAMAVTQIYASTLRETGDSFKPMITGIISVFSDIFFNYLLIYGSLGFPRLGVAGAAIATVAARYLEMILLIVWTYAQKKRYPFIQGLWRTLLVPRALCLEIWAKTAPLFINEFLWSASVAVLTQCYAIRGVTVVASLNISNILGNLFSVIFFSLGQSVGILVGQSLGLGKFERAKKEAFTLTCFSGMLCVILAAILISLSGVFPSFYATTEDVTSLATGFIIVTAVFFPAQGVLNGVYFTLRSGGKTMITFLFDSVYSLAVSLPLAFALCSRTNASILVIFAIIQMTDVLKILIGAILIKKGIWIHNLAKEIA
ncbi:MAG: MATE family efflux transporter [Ruminococcus sp.]|nr:MATE family efflux transporter [Ruminococcus sp.]